MRRPTTKFIYMQIGLFATQRLFPTLTLMTNSLEHISKSPVYRVRVSIKHLPNVRVSYTVHVPDHAEPRIHVIPTPRKKCYFNPSTFVFDVSKMRRI